MNEGFIHLYTGDGKGKTTAAAGLAARAAGYGKRVVFAQFLKGSQSGEVSSLEALGIMVVRSKIDFGFCWEMNGGQRETCRAEQERLLGEARDAGPADLLVLDEALDAISTGMLDEEALKGLVMQKPERLELVVTGRAAPGWLVDMAGYITEMKKVKHPYDLGVKAREAIEY